MLQKHGPSNSVSQSSPRRGTALVLLILLLAGLPAAVWFDMQNLTVNILRNQAADLDSVITSIRNFYSSNIVNHVLSKHESGITRVTDNYAEIPGAIPLPATLSLELGRIIGEKQSNVRYRFISDFPFKNRIAHSLDSVELHALADFRAHPDSGFKVESLSKGLSGQVRYLSPVIMDSSCVACHNSHPNSTKTDWKVGDVRGIQEVTVARPVEINVLWSFKYSLLYFVLVAAVGTYFILMQRRQYLTIHAMNNELESNNNFLASISMKISRYLSPQVYKSIFSGAMDASLQTTRKKLTIFFSDVKGFTEISERLQPEELTALINEYFTEMSVIALKHGGTIDKFIGDAILVFFGDPESQGVAEDAKACMRMALEMQERLAALNIKWRKLGAEEAFRIRIGINTGFCNVGNFGSFDRMDYTILGAEANLAARLQSSAPPDGIVVSYETYALVSDIVSARALPPTMMKGISREVVPYLIEGPFKTIGDASIINEHGDGIDFYLDPEKMDANRSSQVSKMLRGAIDVLERRQGKS